jgi:serine/threonine-protein kinase
MDNDKYIGRLLDGRYEILEVIGTGGMAVVYKARCHRLNRLVAIKILKDDYIQDEEFRRRFRAEGEAVGMLSHPNIVSVYDVSSSNQADFIVMELIDGITLKQYMEKRGYLNWKETLHFAIQIGKALEHAHGRGLVHRDIKPHNVMVLKNGSVKVADFGIARVMSKSNTLTKEALGSVHYISPEQAKGGRVDNRSDIYSLGIVMYEMIAGRVPYDGESPVGVAIQHINGGAVLPSRINPNIPQRLEKIIMRAMALDPEDRYPTATAMLYDMDEFRKTPEVVPAPAPAPAADSRTKVIPVKPTPPPQPKPKTIAERTAVKKDPEAVRSGQRPSKPKQPEPPSGNNRIMTIAILSCAAVVLIALIITLVLISSGAFSNKEDMVRVPELLGEYYDQLGEYEGIEIKRQGSENSEQYEKGQILYQYPKAGMEVVNGTKVFVIVSLGAEAPAKTMEQLTTVKAEEAERFLDGLEMNLNIIKYDEYSSTVPVGSVTRTEPAAGEELKEGQTVRLWVSTGPEIVKAEMPNVVGKTYDKAVSLLEANGFKNIRQNPVDSEEEKGEVIAQSVEKYERVDVTTLIVLDVSTGISEETTEPDVTDPPETTPPETTPPETTPPTTEPSTEPAGPQQLTYGFTVPVSDEPYQLIIKSGGEVVQKVYVIPGADVVRVDLVGNGTMSYDMYLDMGAGEVLYKENILVEFDPDE